MSYDGSIQGVRYDELTPLLLNELQQQQRMLNAQAGQMARMQRELNALRQVNAARHAGHSVESASP